MRRLGLLLLLAACGGEPTDPGTAREAARGPVSRDARTAVVVVVDGLHRERLRAYGSAVEAAPNLTALAAEAAVFDDAVAVSTGANAGLASLLTGQTPARHGVASLRDRGQQRLPATRYTLAEALAEAGWGTFAALSLPQLNGSFSGLDQGFATYLAPGLHERDRRDATTTWFNALPELRALLEAEGNAFVLLHLADLGAPDGAPGKVGARFLEERLGPFRADQPRIAQALDLVAGQPERGREELRKLLARGRGSEEHAAWRAAQADSRLAVVDGVLGELRGLLEATGRGDALLAVTATRGGLLVPPSGSGAASFPPDVVEVPLILRLPGGEPRGRVPGVTSLLGLGPTLAELCGVRLDADAESLLPRLEGAAAGAPAKVVSPGLELAATVTEELLVEENLVAGVIGWRRDGTRVLRKNLEGAEAAAFDAGASSLGAARAEDLPWLVVESGGGVDLRVRWTAHEGFLGGATLEQGTTRDLRPRGLTGSASLESEPGVLRARLGRREASLRLDLDAGRLDPERIWLGSEPLARSLLPRLRDKGGPSWPDEATPAAALQDRGSGWWRLSVGEQGAAGRPVRAVLAAYPPDPRRAALAWDCGPEVEVLVVPGRDDLLELRGVTPLELSVERGPGVQEFGLAVAVDGRVLSGAEVRYGDRAMAEPGQVALYLPDWAGELTGPLEGGSTGEPVASGEVRVRRAGPGQAQGERSAPIREERDFVHKLGARE